MNFWDDYHDPAKGLATKLSVENPDLKSIVEDPYCLGKMRDEDPKLLDYFSRPDIILQLIEGALDPNNEYPDEEIGKYAFNHQCTEVLCFKVPSFYDAIFAHQEAMEYLASYLQQYREKLNHLVISFYCKIISALYVHNTNELIEHFTKHKFLDAVFDCLEYGAVYELLVNLSARILPDDREPVKKWLVGEDFGKRMLEAFKKSKDFITMENIGFLWSEYVKALRDFCYAYEITDELLDNIQRPELVELLLAHIFPENKEARDWDAVAAGCIVIQAYYESSFDMNLPSMDITKTLTERPSKVLIPDPDFAVEKICSRYLADFLEVGYEAWKQQDGDVMTACLSTAEAVINSSQTEIHSVFVQQLKLFGFERWLTAFKEDPTATIAVNSINAIVGLILHSMPSVESLLIRYLITDARLLSIIMDAVANEPAQFSLVKLKAFRSCFYRLAERVEFARERSQNYDIIRKLISEAPEAAEWNKFCENTLKPYLAENLPEDSITNQTVSDLSTNLDLCVDEVMDVSGEDEDEKQTLPQTEFKQSPAHDIFEDLSQRIFPDAVEVAADIPEATTANTLPAQSMEVDDWPTNSSSASKEELEHLFEKLKSSQPLDMSMNSSGEVVALTDSSVKSLNDTADFFAGLAPVAQSPPPEDDWPTTELKMNLSTNSKREAMTKRKVLLMGKSGAGKTSMRSIIFANYIARDCDRLGPTMEIEHAHVRFLGSLVLLLWDCGGQEAFMENYMSSQRDQIFKNVQVLIYVFDVESREIDKDYRYYQGCLEALLQNSPEAKVFCLVHKMDLISEENRDKVFEDKVSDIRRISNATADRLHGNIEIECYRSSIWDETLYKAWSAIVYQLVPNVTIMEQKLRQFAEIMDADEILLFEKATFLVVSQISRKEHPDQHRFEKVSNIIKQFKLSCSRMGAQFDSIHIKNSEFSAFIDTFTNNTYIMSICDGNISTAAVMMNIKSARKHFEKLDSK